MDRAEQRGAAAIQPSDQRRCVDGSARHEEVLPDGRREVATTQSAPLPNSAAQDRFSPDGNPQQATEVPVAAEPTWDMVEAYFPGWECERCPYMRAYRTPESRFTYCGLVRPWKGLGRAPEPSDCRGVVRQLEDAE